MERENKKRGREEEGEGGGRKDLLVKRTLKKQSQGRVVLESHQDESNISSDNCMGLGVFDFPWLHDDDGIISKSDSDEWKFEDTFSTSLDDIKFSGQLQWQCQWQQQYLYETTPPPPTMNLNTNMEMNFPDNEFERPFKGDDDEVDELEVGNVDCSIWSSIIN